MGFSGGKSAEIMIRNGNKSHLRSLQRKRLALLEALESRKLLTVIPAATAAEFTAALSAAQLGDTIELKAGNTFVGQFTLPNKTTGSGWITIQSSAVGLLPDGQRVSPA